MIHYHLKKWLWCTYKGIHFTIINHLYICMHETKKSNNQSKHRPSQNFGQVKGQVRIYRILNYALLIVNVSVESNSWKYNLINWHWPVFLLSSSFQFPSSYLSDHSDSLKMPQLSLNVNHRQLNNHHKMSTKHIRNTKAMAERIAYRLLIWSSPVRFSLCRYCF